MDARPFIDSLDFAGNGREIGGEVPVAELPRVQEVLESPQGILSYTVRGGVDKLGSQFLDVSVAGRCQVRCQRCLEAMDQQVQLDTRLLLRDQASLDALESGGLLMEQLAIPLGRQNTTAEWLVMAGHPDEEEEFDSILADAHLDVLNLLEDEILLSLPFAPKHEQGACQAAGGENTPLQQAQDRHVEERNPFAALAKLKRN